MPDGLLTAGEELHAARVALGLSLDEVAERTRIPVRYLQALEDDDLSVFPSGPFLTGFSKKYRALLGLPERAVSLRAAAPMPELTSTVTSPASPSSATRKRAIRTAAIGGVLAVTALLLMRVLGASAPEAEPTIGEPMRLFLEVDVEEAVRARVYSDGEREFAEALKPGPPAVFAGRDEVRIELETLSGVELTFQGKQLKPLGHQSRSRRLVFIDDGG